MAMAKKRTARKASARKGATKKKTTAKRGAAKKSRASKQLPSATTPRKAVEAVKTMSLDSMIAAAKKLRASRKPQKVLLVPTNAMAKGRAAMREVGIGGTVKNLTGTKTSVVRKSEAKAKARTKAKAKTKTKKARTRKRKK
jgi:hypothetical protein